jgi:hypothetical protein
MDSSDDDKPVRGRPFASGNPGRKHGSKNRLRRFAETLLCEEGEELVRKVVDLAKAGNMQALKLVFERIFPKERTVDLALPEITSAFDAVIALNSVMLEVAEGGISPKEAAEIATLVLATSQAVNKNELELRVAAIEEKL